MSEQQPKKGGPAFWKDLVSGTIGGTALVVVGHPLDTLKVRLQTMPAPLPGQAPMYAGTVDCIIKTFRGEGLRGFYKGMLSPILGVSPMYAIVFGAYGTAKNMMRKSADDPLTISQIFWAGCLTGIATTAVTVPVELIKSRLQIQKTKPGEKPEFTGLTDCAKKIYSKSGTSGLFKGTVATLWRDVPGSGIYFGTYEFVKRALTPEGKSTSPFVALFAGGMAGVSIWCTVFPVDVIKSRIQTDLSGIYKSGHAGMLQCGRDIVRESGVAGLYKGIGPALLRSFPANAACFVAVEATMKLIKDI